MERPALNRQGAGSNPASRFMEKDDDGLRVNPGYALGQLEKALRSGGASAPTRFSRWRLVLAGMFDGSLRHGSRTPVADAPSWVTLEVVHGGFATGAFAAAGDLQPHEISLLQSAAHPAGVSVRAILNGYFLGDAGREVLRSSLASRDFRVSVPEEAALLVATWLIDRGEGRRAESLLEAIAPFMDRLRFYPTPSDRPLVVSDHVHLRSAGDTVARLRARRPNIAVAAMNEAIVVWTPLYDRAVALFLETVEGEVPRLARTETGELQRRDGTPVVEGGWPCRRYSDDWAQRARELLADYEHERASHQLSGKPERPKENFARLRAFLLVAADDPRALSGRDVGMIRKILASFVHRHGAPESDRRAATRASQKLEALRPGHHELARILARRLDGLDPEDGVANIDDYLGSLTDSEAAEVGGSPGEPLPRALEAKATACLAAPVEMLLRRGLIHSSEGLGVVLPSLVAASRANAIDVPELRAVYAASYQAFRRRRSLLLLDLERQVRFGELPWISAIEPWVGTTEASQQSAQSAARRASWLALKSFPQTIIPNSLVRELRTLLNAAGAQVPLVSEVAADIFMGAFSETFLRAAQVAMPMIDGTLYARYYDVPVDRIMALDDVEDQRWASASSPGFAALCTERAGASDTARRSVARNGTIIEQAQILTTHNLAPLISCLALEDDVRVAAPDMAQQCFRWICHRQQLAGDNWRAQMQHTKNSAYAWRQMIFYLSLAGDAETSTFINWADALLAAQKQAFQTAFEPAMEGLRKSARGESLDSTDEMLTHTGARRFLGWTTERHWLLRPEVSR